MIKTKVR